MLIISVEIEGTITNLNLSPFHDCPIQFFSCSVSLSCTFEGDKSEALYVFPVIVHLLGSLNIFSISLICDNVSAYLGPSLIEDNFYIEDFAKLLSVKQNFDSIKGLN